MEHKAETAETGTVKNATKLRLAYGGIYISKALSGEHWD